ncbi:MAG: branched-chain amino acid ABC transporter permease, partial [Desulfobulbaceae bacterium]|nr:branched-chain amino acid ABC transporter permease [Desulfobulbaceae bacterium]
MDIQDHTSQLHKKGFRARLQGFFATVPLIGWFLGFLGAVLVEYFLGDLISYYLYLPKIPVLFGLLSVLKKHLLIPG